MYPWTYCSIIRFPLFPSQIDLLQWFPFFDSVPMEHLNHFITSATTTARHGHYHDRIQIVVLVLDVVIANVHTIHIVCSMVNNVKLVVPSNCHSYSSSLDIVVHNKCMFFPSDRSRRIINAQTVNESKESWDSNQKKKKIDSSNHIFSFVSCSSILFLFGGDDR